MLRKKLTIILGIIAVLAIMISACAAEPTDAEMDEPVPQEDSADEDLTVDDEMENEHDTDDSDNDSADGNDDGMGDAGTEEGESSSGEDLPDEMNDEEMLAFLEEKLEGEHSVDFIFSQDKTYDEWVQTFENHINYGLELSEEARDLLINWLLERAEGMMDEGEEEMALSDEEMEALIEEKIAGQHTLDFILGQDKTYDEWVTTIDRMIGYGANINEEEKELIIQWLINR